MKRCPRCSETKAPSEFYVDRSKRDGLTSWCRLCRQDQAKSWAEKFPRRRQEISWKAQGIECSAERFEELLESQGGVCAICSATCRRGFQLSVDHDHETGSVRGLLCRECNLGIGSFEDSPARLRQAARYLESR